jgi:hypothetical protein
MKGFVDFRRNGFGKTGKGNDGGVEGIELAEVGGLGGPGGGNEGTGGIEGAGSSLWRSWLAGVKVASKKFRFILGVTGESARSWSRWKALATLSLGGTGGGTDPDSRSRSKVVEGVAFRRTVTWGRAGSESLRGCTIMSRWNVYRRAASRFLRDKMTKRAMNNPSKTNPPMTPPTTAGRFTLRCRSEDTGTLVELGCEVVAEDDADEPGVLDGTGKLVGAEFEEGGCVVAGSDGDTGVGTGVAGMSGACGAGGRGLKAATAVITLLFPMTVWAGPVTAVSE